MRGPEGHVSSGPLSLWTQLMGSAFWLMVAELCRITGQHGRGAVDGLRLGPHVEGKAATSTDLIRKVFTASDRLIPQRARNRKGQHKARIQKIRSL